MHVHVHAHAYVIAGAVRVGYLEFTPDPDPILVIDIMNSTRITRRRLQTPQSLFNFVDVKPSVYYCVLFGAVCPPQDCVKRLVQVRNSKTNSFFTFAVRHSIIA